MMDEVTEKPVKPDWNKVSGIIQAVLLIVITAISIGNWVRARETSEAAVIEEVKLLRVELKSFTQENKRLHEQIPDEFVTKQELKIQLDAVNAKLDLIVTILPGAQLALRNSLIHK